MLKCIENTMWGINLNYDYLKWVSGLATKLGLEGIAFFKNDGSVKVVAEGEESNLLFFIKELKHSHSFENFSTMWHEPRHEFEGFLIG